MTQSTQLQDKVIEELNVMKDDIHVTSDEDALTFYCFPTNSKNLKPFSTRI